jgi:hypothetical protein
MSEPYLTMAEIEDKYPNEWVLIDHAKIGRYQRVLGGFVVAHTTNRDEMDRRMVEYPGNSTIAVRYTGKMEMDPDEAVLLHLDFLS